jgi:DNA-binding transcriptional LysR family regulator
MLYYSKELLIPAINSFQQSFPGVKLHFLSKTPGEVLTAILSGEIDVGNLLRVDFEGCEQLKFQDIYQEPMVLMVNTAHRFAKQGVVSVKELVGEHFVNISDVFYKGYYDYLRQLLQKYDTEIDPQPYMVQDYESLLLAVQAGKGVAILSSNMKKQIHPCSVYLDFEEKDIVIRRCLAYRDDNDNPTIAHFLEQFNYRVYPE